MKCRNCAAENPVGKKFCGECGVRLSVPKCPNCGAENPEGKRFCGDCGAELIVSPSSNAESVEPMIPREPSEVGTRSHAEWNLRRIGRSALMIGFGVFVVSIVLFKLSEALVDQAARLFVEADYERAIDVTNLAILLDQGAWATLVVAIVSLVVGAIVLFSSEK